MQRIGEIGLEGCRTTLMRFVLSEGWDTEDGWDWT